MSHTKQLDPSLRLLSPPLLETLGQDLLVTNARSQPFAESVRHTLSCKGPLHPIRPFEELALLRRKCHNSYCLIFTGSHSTDKWELIHTCFHSVT